MNTRNMLVEVVPARVQVALEVMHQYGTPFCMPVPMFGAGQDIEARRCELSIEEKYARDTAAELLRAFMAGQGQFMHAVLQPQMSDVMGGAEKGPAPG